MMKLGVGALYKNLGRMWGWIAPRVRNPKNVALNYDIGKMSTGRLVLYNDFVDV